MKVIAGRDKGKTGRVISVDRKHGTVLVEGVSMVKRHTRPNPHEQIKGGIAERESSIDDLERDGSDLAAACPPASATRWKAPAPPRAACAIARKTGEAAG